MKQTNSKLIIRYFFTVVILLTLAGSLNSVSAQLKVASVFTEHMVVQRDKPLNIWGTAKAGDQVEVSFNRQTIYTKAEKNGKWLVSLKPMVFGGPYSLEIRTSKEKLEINDILIGDVWFCSGQSNMEMPLAGWGKVKNFEQEIANADHPGIRLLTVEKNQSFTPLENITGNWQVCSPQSVGEFSATAYFFGRKLNQELEIPIGLICSSWGGTNIQTWISWDTIQTRPEYKNKKVSDFQSLVEKWAANQKKFEEALTHDPGEEGKWFLPETSIQSWQSVTLPKGFEQSEVGNIDGIVWFRRDFNLSEDEANAAAELSLGVIDDHDDTYVNGQLVGQTDDWFTPRNYKITPGILKAGKNTIVIKVLDRAGGGGFAGKPADMVLKSSVNKIVALSGEWKFMPAVTTGMYEVGQDGPNRFPSKLYNAMVAPIIQFPIKGVIWYQGEENTNYPAGYAELFQMLIKNWREKWHDELPFFWAQLANFMAPDSIPAETPWATIRNNQHQALSLPKTGEAVLIDLGEAYDIHPKNKQDVGGRLALSALNVTYVKQGVFSGPVLQSYRVDGNKMILSFNPMGSSLIAKGDKYGYVRGFAIAGSDHQYKWTKAFIQGNQVVVFNETIGLPVTVRYAWGNNPDDANLYNQAGLPASPFEIDSN